MGGWPPAIRRSSLIAWLAKAGPNDTDPVSGASRIDHTQPLTIAWDLKDRQGTLIPDGTYTVRMALADSNATIAANNRQGTFTFIKGATAQDQTGLSNGGFNTVSLHFDPNGVINPPPTNPPSTNPPPSSGSDDPPMESDYDAVEGGCTAGGSGAGLAVIALAGVLSGRRRRATDRSRNP